MLEILDQVSESVLSPWGNSPRIVRPALDYSRICLRKRCALGVFQQIDSNEVSDVSVVQIRHSNSKLFHAGRVIWRLEAGWKPDLHVHVVRTAVPAIEARKLLANFGRTIRTNEM